MDEELKELVRTLLVVEVLNLAKAIEAERRAGGTVMADFLGHAIKEIQQKRAEVLRRLAQMA